MTVPFELDTWLAYSKSMSAKPKVHSQESVPNWQPEKPSHTGRTLTDREREKIASWSDQYRRAFLLTKLKERGLSDEQLATFGILVKDSDSKKSLLLKMAVSGSPRPGQRAADSKEKVLGRALSQYTSQGGGSYDPIFDMEIRLAASHWFVDATAAAKEALLEMAREQKKRPNKKSKDPVERKLGQALVDYTGKFSKSYDPAFEIQIKSVGPHWFVDSAQLKKDKLLTLAKDGCPKPSSRSSKKEERLLATALSRYLSPSQECYDVKFAILIKSVRADWFSGLEMKPKKDTLIIMAAAGHQRPMRTSSNLEERQLGNALHAYTTPTSSSFDAEFRDKMTASRPDWFRK
jgi:hypothetical protein